MDANDNKKNTKKIMMNIRIKLITQIVHMRVYIRNVAKKLQKIKV